MRAQLGYVGRCDFWTSVGYFEREEVRAEGRVARSGKHRAPAANVVVTAQHRPAQSHARSHHGSRCVTYRGHARIRKNTGGKSIFLMDVRSPVVGGSIEPIRGGVGSGVGGGGWMDTVVGAQIAAPEVG
jgi:hypothetical protein